MDMMSLAEKREDQDIIPSNDLSCIDCLIPCLILLCLIALDKTILGLIHSLLLHSLEKKKIPAITVFFFSPLIEDLDPVKEAMMPIEEVLKEIIEEEETRVTATKEDVIVALAVIGMFF